MIKNFDELLDKVRSLPPKRVAIPAAHAKSAIFCATLAKQEGIGNFLLIGNKKKILEQISMIEESLIDAFEIINEDDPVACVDIAVQAVRNKEADTILKGACTTAQLMKGVLNKETGLNAGKLISIVSVFETKERLIIFTDGGLVLYPTLEEKVSLINNAVYVAHKMECPKPNVAVLCAIETPNLKMPPTLDAALLSKMNQRGEMPGCVVDGPLALDNAISEHAAKVKGLQSPIAGKADILLLPSIEAGNIFAKSMTYYANFRSGHVIIGAKVPILIASRADDAWTKLHSVALGVLCS
ncbi:MAG TPA: hypothetical protein ENG70_05815 [Candidatus Cloacimonetes bacterium]|nr:hypothetical protein [Candidatus Cloacimonadota bacterium]HEX38348.1 hypothetical protein [Candidatus Cloacimonadota bacterium]